MSFRDFSKALQCLCVLGDFFSLCCFNKCQALYLDLAPVSPITYWTFLPVYPAVTSDLAAGETNSPLWLPKPRISSGLPWHTYAQPAKPAALGNFWLAHLCHLQNASSRCILLNSPLERIPCLPSPSHCSCHIPGFHVFLSSAWGLQPSLHNYSTGHPQFGYTCLFISGSAKRWLEGNSVPSVISHSPASLNKQMVWVTALCHADPAYVHSSCILFQTVTVPLFLYGNFGASLAPYCLLSTPNVELSPSIQAFSLSSFGIPLDFLIYILVIHMGV